MTDYRDQVVQALRAVRVTSATTYAWFGRRSPPLPRPVVMALSADAAREYLVGLVAGELYRSFYTQGRAVPVNPDTARPDRPDDEFVEGLSLANNGTGGWDSGWRVEKAAPGILHVERNGLRVRVRSLRLPLGTWHTRGWRLGEHAPAQGAHGGLTGLLHGAR